jgi:hypothetical protein
VLSYFDGAHQSIHAFAIGQDSNLYANFGDCRAALKSRIASLYFSMLFRDLTTMSLHSNHGLVYLNSGQSYA